MASRYDKDVARQATDEIAARKHKVANAISIEVTCGHGMRRCPYSIVNSHGESAVAISQEHCHGVGVLTGNGQIQSTVPIPVRVQEELRIIAHRVTLLSGEGPIAPPQQDRNVVGTGVRSGQVQAAIAVNVAHANPVVVGFREQSAVVNTGVKALISRAALEGISMVIEGVHLVPGYLDPRQFATVRVVQIVIGVDDEQSHRSHFYIREAQTHGTRPHRRYENEFDSIRVLGRYIEDLAREHDIPVIYTHQLDQTIADVLETVVSAAIDEG